MLPLNILVLKAVSKLPQKDLSLSNTNFGDIKPLGLELYNNWIIAFELISIFEDKFIYLLSKYKTSSFKII